ncbi:hypothetical protein M409DRAFT_59331 [Zasmidium cellare ATCC 36951]|uniref:BZIP domain-containing protein n=1 Tax=Zasmidium cellare ATCC 36951 TaxID=1080233 RepID=A0A6A6C636_ZASCE|nr:uncharacterized protein M409DRAFT_59331 [Zasmidium cellare ATCC 36951]KAF2161342.1 hypothetical protein M409DRAFT_59331 [Zasmidium cellare ATCC 36951]
MAYPSSREDSLVPDAFDPQPDFLFEDGGDHELANMQNMEQNLSNIMPNHFDPASFMVPFMMENAPMSPSLHPPYTQADIIANGRGIGVSFGQITPPEEDFKVQDVPPPPSLSTPATQTLSAKSERARNAANQRHSKAKKARKDSVRKAEDPDEVEQDQAEDKRELYRQKNRIAASRCRAKKKMNTEGLEESARAASAQNSRLRAEERHLRDLFSTLRDQALAHDPSQGCNCQAIHAYNFHKARECAQATMGFIPGMMPSPTQRSIDSGSPSTVGTASRAQSFSSVRPQFAKTSGGSQSSASSAAFVPGAADVTRHASTIGGMSKSPFAFAVSTAQIPQDSPVMGGESDGNQN